MLASSFIRRSFDTAIIVDFLDNLLGATFEPFIVQMDEFGFELHEFEFNSPVSLRLKMTVKSRPECSSFYFRYFIGVNPFETKYFIAARHSTLSKFSTSVKLCPLLRSMTNELLDMPYGRPFERSSLKKVTAT